MPPLCISIRLTILERNKLEGREGAGGYAGIARQLLLLRLEGMSICPHAFIRPSVLGAFICLPNGLSIRPSVHPSNSGVKKNDGNCGPRRNGGGLLDGGYQIKNIS